MNARTPNLELRKPAAAASRPVRLLTLTTLFPNGCHPRHGIFVANRLRRLCDTGRIEATVIAAVPRFPGAYRDTVAISERETVNGFYVRHPRFINIPGIGMRVQPDFLARALLEDLRRGGVRVSDFDVIDAHYFYPDGVAAVRVAHALGLPLVVTARGSDINLIGDMTFARERMVDAAGRAQALIAVSAALAAKMTAIGMPAERIHVLRNGVDPCLFAPVPRVQARAKLGLANDCRWILGVGNLVPDKGFDLLIRSVAMLDDVRLLLVGEGRLRDELASLAQALAPGRVEFRPNMLQSELRYAYSAGDVLGLASLREGWPNVVLEAIACGTPVVAAAVGGVPEILGSEAPARTLDHRDPTRWRDALRSLIDASLSPDVVRSYANRFAWDDIVDQQCALYERVAGSPPPFRDINQSVPSCG